MPGSPTDTAMAAAMSDNLNTNSNSSSSSNAGGDPMFWFMFHHATVGIAFISLDGFILQVNPELCRFLGYPEEQLRTLTYHEITHPDDLLNSTQLYGKLANGELAIARMETRFMRSDGVAIWGQLSMALVLDGAGRPAHFMSMISDITLRKRAQAELEWTRSRYGSILDKLDDVVFLCDSKHIILYVNQTCRKLLGWTNEEMLGSYLYNYIHPDDQQAVQDNHELLSSGSDEQPQVKCRVCREDGTWLRLDTYSRAVRDPLGEVMEIIGVGREAQKQEPVPNPPTQMIEQAATPTQAVGKPASTDPLTDLRNRSACDDLLTTRLTSWRSSAFPVGCLLVDIDHLKSVNDTYGQSVGDEVLKRVAAVLDGSCRDDDFVARYGGDEFLVVLPGTNAAGTIILGEKLVRNVREEDWSDLRLRTPITISVGATSVQHGSGLTLPELLGILHTQTEQAKEGGRNRMVMNTRQIAKEK